MTDLPEMHNSPAMADHPDIEIHLGMPQPWTHYFQVRMTVKGILGETLDLVMPVWTPGSYLVREYSRNLLGFSAKDDSGKSLTWEKASKNIWRVRTCGSAGLTVEYLVYAFDLSVRASFLDDIHGYLNGASLFMYVDGYRHIPCRLTIEPYPGWERISTGLDSIPGIRHGFRSPDFDTLVDCPIEIGNQEVSRFLVREVPHFISIYGDGNHDSARLAEDFQKIVDTAAGIMGDIPYQHYTFLLQLVHDGQGGLEHANSMSIQVNRWAFRPEKSYRRFLELIAHEYFHVWNGKRLRPIELGPFDYTRENYTRLLWVSEGFTDYYASQILRRAGLITAGEYLAGISKAIQDLQETPGRLIESAAEASFDAWIKYYRQDAHSPNVEVSYYLKGCLIGLVLDLEIRYRTEDRTLDDVMRMLYREYFQKRQRGFTDDEFRLACESVAGSRLDEIFQDYCYGTREIDFARYLGYAALKFADPAANGKVKTGSFLGISTKTVDGRLQVVGVRSGAPACEHGFNLNDEIIAMNGFRVNQDILIARMEDAAPGTEVDFMIARDGRLRNIPVVLGKRMENEYRIERIEEAQPIQKRMYESWLKTRWAGDGKAS